MSPIAWIYVAVALTLYVALVMKAAEDTRINGWRFLGLCTGLAVMAAIWPCSLLGTKLYLSLKK